MKCQEFQERLSELASEVELEAGLRARAEAHTARCETCAARWLAQRALQARLQEFAAATRELPAPHVRQRLRAVLAEQQQIAAVPGAPVVDLAAARAARQASPGVPRWGWLAAAAMFTLVALSLNFWQRLTSLSEPSSKEEMTLAVPAPALPALPVVITPQLNYEVSKPRPVKAAVHEPNRRLRRLELAQVQEETNNEFVPLTLAVDERALENPTLVRLEVPRARLVALGLPLPVHGDREMVNAEVMLGDNGVAYAIRVVR